MDVQIKIRIRSQWLKRRLVRLLDWWWHERMKGPDGNDWDLLPEWPTATCGHITQHKEELRWSDRLSDRGGVRCRCGLRGLHDDGGLA